MAMCGIVDLLTKKLALREHLSELMMPILFGMMECGGGVHLAGRR